MVYGFSDDSLTLKTIVIAYQEAVFIQMTNIHKYSSYVHFLPFRAQWNPLVVIDMLPRIWIRCMIFPTVLQTAKTLIQLQSTRNIRIRTSSKYPSMIWILWIRISFIFLAMNDQLSWFLCGSKTFDQNSFLLCKLCLKRYSILLIGMSCSHSFLVFSSCLSISKLSKLHLVVYHIVLHY